MLPIGATNTKGSLKIRVRSKERLVKPCQKRCVLRLADDFLTFLDFQEIAVRQSTPKVQKIADYWPESENFPGSQLARSGSRGPDPGSQGSDPGSQGQIQGSRGAKTG